MRTNDICKVLSEYFGQVFYYDKEDGFYCYEKETEDTPQKWYVNSACVSDFFDDIKVLEKLIKFYKQEATK